MLVTARATGGKMVSLPQEANREARFNMAVERARAKERERAIQQFRQTAAGDVRASISHHCVSIDTLADDVLRTPDLGCDAWEFAPDVSTQCEKVMTFATEQNQGRNPSGRVQDGRRLLTRRGRREPRSFCNALLRPIKSQCFFFGFQKPNDT